MALKKKGIFFIMFKCQPGYTLRKIKGINYLLPYGQQIADLKKGFVLNETSTFLWNVLQHHESAEPQQLAEILARTYQLDESFYHEFSDDDTSQEIELVTTPPPSRCYGQVLLQNSEMTVFENPDRYVVLFPQMQNLYEAHMLKDGTYVRVYCHPQVSETNIENLFHAIRLFFLFTAQRNGLFAIHSASVLYQGKAWLFSGHSGMGKSTHTALWHELFDTPYLNGDLNLLGLHKDHIIAYGIPWCGTSGIFTAEAYELGGIILLGRDLQTDYLEELNPSEKILRVMQRMISPAWTERQLSENLFFAGEIADRVPVLHLLCTKNFSAACVMKNTIDQLEELQ